MSGFLRGLFFTGDLLFLNLSIFAALYWHGTAPSMQEGSSAVYLVVFSNISWLFLVLVSTPYGVTKGWALSRIVRSQLAFLVIHLLVVASLITFFRQRYSITQVSIIYLVFIPLFFSLRIITLYLRKLITSEMPVKNYVLIGRNHLSEQVRKYYLMNSAEGYRFKGQLDFQWEEFSVNFIRDFCAKNDIQEIICCVPITNERILKEIIEFSLNSLTKVRILARTPGLTDGNIEFDKTGQNLPDISRTTIKMDAPSGQFFKRLFDIVASFIFTALIASWLFPLIALAIRIDSPGPVFFVQLRSGRGNKPFRCFKFRTMVVNKDSETRQATRDDKRITKLGHFLRKTSIDELPQFINVLIGTMSVVGPRPHMLSHTDEYSKLIDQFMGRHYVKPGITGLAQCLGFRGETKDVVDMENRVRMDRYYIENWSFWFDLKIIFLTVVSLIRGSDKAF